MQASGMTHRSWMSPKVWLRHAGSLRFAVVLLGVAFVLLILHAGLSPTAAWVRGAVFAVLGLNLLACFVQRSRGVLRRPAIALFHLGLVCVLALAAWGRMTHYRTRLQVATGQSVRLASSPIQRGPWAPAWLGQLSVMLERLQTEYWPGGLVRSTRAWLSMHSGNQPVLRELVEPNQPASYREARITLTPTQGFAAIFNFQPMGRGLIYFPRYRNRPNQQEQMMYLPGMGSALHCRLALTDDMDQPGPGKLAAPSTARVVVTGAGLPAGRSLAPGEAVQLDQGVLRLEAIQPWAGLVIDYDPSVPWLLGLALVSTVSLLWHWICQWRGRTNEVLT